MAKFLDLAPELRVLICKHLVVSPTGFVEPIHQMEGRRRNYPASRKGFGPRFYLKVSNALQVSDPMGCEYPPSTTVPDFISTSILSVCRTTYKEAQPLFWESNTFIFPSPDVMDYTIGGMGSRAAGLITSIRLWTLASSDIRLVLRSMDRELAPASLQHADLVLRREGVKVLSRLRINSDMGCAQNFFLVLFFASKIEILKQLIVPGNSVFEGEDDFFVQHALATIESEWGSKIVWGDTLSEEKPDEMEKTDEIEKKDETNQIMSLMCSLWEMKL